MASLLLHIDFSSHIKKIKGYVRCNREVKRVLASFAFAVYMNTKNHAYNRKYAEVVAKATSKKEALKKIQSEILKDLRRLWRKRFGDGA